MATTIYRSFDYTHSTAEFDEMFEDGEFGPGSPANTEDFARIRRHVLRDAETLASAGIHGLIVENFGDAPCFVAFNRERVPDFSRALTRFPLAWQNANTVVLRIEAW